MSCDNGGFAISNAPPLSDDKSSSLPSPLNIFVGESVDQTFRLMIDKSANHDVAFGGVTDVILGLEYTAEIPAPVGA